MLHTNLGPLIYILIFKVEKNIFSVNEIKSNIHKAKGHTVYYIVSAVYTRCKVLCLRIDDLKNMCTQSLHDKMRHFQLEKLLAE